MHMCAPRHHEIEPAAAAWTIAREVEPVSVLRDIGGPVVEARIDVARKLLGRLLRTVNARSVTDPDVLAVHARVPALEVEAQTILRDGVRELEFGGVHGR